MNKFYPWLLMAFFLFSLNTYSMEKFSIVPIGDINECNVRVRKDQAQDHIVWEVNDPKYNSNDEFNSLTAKVYAAQDGSIMITSMEFPEVNTSRIRAVNAFFNGITIYEKNYSKNVYIWVNDDETPYKETILAKIISRFGFKEIDNPMIENFTPQTLGQGGFLKATIGDVYNKIIK
jgi:hypothetical protein